MGMLAGYVPWLIYLNRTVFQFYGIIYEPYMILAITLAISVILGKRTDQEHRRTAGIAWVSAYGVLAILLSIFFYPLWSGMQIPYWYWHIHMWLPGWI
jgi:dolichyl-phosphate-mannose--protein O-mannosyl transferase